ncbi:MAG: ABC transporter substrate-binding protein [Propionibacteriaceae bacterium]|jgi:peptide/nickel transport system substrate-binding protein|nr:ABC transporter substrate-binding protein [Propionibacteriaceae bacterium]
MKLKTLGGLATAATLALAGLTACGGDSGDAATSVVVGTLSDPGSLDPQLSVVSALFEISGYAYDTLVGLTPDGDVVPQVAESWTYDGTTAVFTLHDDVTCSDGSTLSAQTVADNFTWVEDLNNASPYLGVFVPAGLTATADAAANTVTLTLAAPAPFLLESIANFPLVCAAGLADRSLLAAGTVGSGPYELTEAVPDDHYTYTLRDGYTWGPDGATSDGLPQTLTLRIVGSESTGVNLLLTGEVNVMTTTGADGDRAEAAGLAGIDVPALLGETWYNHAEGHPTADAGVRQALTEALDLAQLATVVTGGTGGPATMMAVVPPTTCSYDSITAALPAYSAAAAGATLEQAGYAMGADGVYAKDGQPLTLKFLYDSNLGTAGQAAAELAIQQWTAAGIAIDAQELDTTRLSEVLFGTGDWDIAWEPINIGSPDQLVGFLSGPALADGGANFSSIANSAYDAAVANALAAVGDAACAGFATAETALFDNYDLVAWAVRPNKIYLNGVTLAYTGKTQVTSLRVTG